MEIKSVFKTSLLLIFIATVAGCGYTAYLGLHGQSIRNFPDVHESVTRDQECLDCHHPDNDPKIATPHPKFRGCLKCHNDNIEAPPRAPG